jgi:hypothetical protein
MVNKNSIYVGALTSFILDTKPYHAKLTEIQEIYQFSDEMTVHFEERLFSTLMTKAAWPYTYFSSGVPESVPGVGQPMSLHQLVSPLIRGYTRNNDPLNCRGAFKAFRDESHDLPLVPFAFDPQQIQGVGLSDAFVQRNGSINLNEPLLEGHDVFLSKGAYVFQIKQTVNTQPPVVGRYTHEWTATDGPYPVLVSMTFTNADALVVIGPATQVSLTSISVTGPGLVKVTGLSNSLNYDPLFTERQKENTLAAATTAVQVLALDVSNPASAVNKIAAVLGSIEAQLLLTPNANASAELAIIQGVLSTPMLPNSYEGLLNALIAGATPVIVGYAGWRGRDITAPYADAYVDQTLSALSPGLYFNLYTDVANRESGRLQYANVKQSGVTVSNIHGDPFRVMYEEWTLKATAANTFLVYGSSSGSIGAITLPSGAFSSPQLGFDFSGPATVPVGTTIVLTPGADITVHYDAPLETWSLIKTNPLAYSRPVFSSTRYGFIRSQTLALNQVTILDTGLPTGTLVLTATSPTTFDLTSTAEATYNATIPVNTAFNDGRVAFTIVAGSAYTFTVGDKFFIEIENHPPYAEGLDLYYGYDFDSYDAGSPSYSPEYDVFGNPIEPTIIVPTGPMVYNNMNALLADYLKSLDFNFDSRFIGYDLTTFGLVLTPNTAQDVQWRLRAVADLSMPLNLHPITSPATGTNEVSVIATNDPLNPLAILQVDMANTVTGEGVQSSNDPDVVADLLLYYATSFELEYYNDVTMTWVSVDNVPINAPYTNLTHGLSFTIVQTGKPFIAAVLNSSRYDSPTGPIVAEQLFGGDTIAWTVRNDPPVQLEPASLTSRRIPRLVMYGDSYHFSIPASWTLTYTGPSQYDLQGTHVGGSLNGQHIFDSPISVNTTDNGRSYKNDAVGIHYTVVNGAAGLAGTDSFTFSTFSRKPSYLVHGSVTGWQADAVVGEWYWNGKIGFKIPVAEVWLFNASGDQLGAEAPWITTFGQITLNYLRADAKSATYRIKSQAAGHWTLYRNGALIADGVNIVGDQTLSVTMPTAPIGTEFILSVRGQERPLTIGHDLAIVRTTAGREPTANDFVLLERSKSDTLSISIKPKDPAHAMALQPLSAVGTAYGQVLTNVDHFTTSGVPLSVTSPETAVLQGWIPLLETRYDKGLSIAEFSDAQTHVVVRAAATGETIGEVLSLGPTPAEPVIFRWDTAFHRKYLPLNAEAMIVTLGSGMNDRVNVNMTDDVLFLISGGGLLEDVLFADVMQANILDTTTLSISSTYNEAAGITIADGPFGGFMPGYDNLQFDFEAGVGDLNSETPDGYYDAGVPLTDWFQQAQGLSLLSSLTAPQQALLNELLSVLGPWLDGDILTTTLTEFVANIGASPPTQPLHNNPLNWTPTTGGFGIPAVGMGMQIETSSTGTASTNIAEAASILAVDFGYGFNQVEYDIGPLDEPPESTLVMFPSGLPQDLPAPFGGPVPFSAATIIPGVRYTIKSVGSTDYTTLGAPDNNPLTMFVATAAGSGTGTVISYELFDTRLAALAVGRIIEVSFNGLPVFSTVKIWRPTDPEPSIVPVVERPSARRLRFNLPAPAELKVIIV